jgi:hypothetical protein
MWVGVLQAIMHTKGLDERALASWRNRAGKHCKRVRYGLVERRIILDLPLTQYLDGSIGVLPFGAAIPPPILISPIPIVFPVCLIVLAIRRDQVIEGETIVAGPASSQPQW